jgi:hypothetical protein
VLILYCDRVESICELVCGGVRLPFSRAAHIFRGLISSYPLISDILFRRWWFMVWVQLARWVWRGVCVSGIPSQIRGNRKTHTIKASIRSTIHRYLCQNESVIW